MTNHIDGAMGFYTVSIRAEGIHIPYVVLAQSDYHAARIVRSETGVMASEADVQGPFAQR